MGGLAVVGEAGPEVVRLPAGASVTPASQSRGMGYGAYVHMENVRFGSGIDAQSVASKLAFKIMHA
jgi:hypothetical protein